MRTHLLALAGGLIVFLSGCAGTSVPETGTETAAAPLTLTDSSFSALPGWHSDDMKGFMNAYNASCARILKKDAKSNFASDPAWGTYADWQEPCRTARSVDANNPVAVRAFIERHFKVMKAGAGTETQGLFTGYYESTLRGSRNKHGTYQHPLLARPSDLVMVELGDFRDELKGQRIAGRIRDGKLKPYESRKDIVEGRLSSELAKPLVWLDDARDAFFVQVQGSGTVHLDDGSTMRVGYDGQNGHPYYAIGRELVKRGVYTKEEVSMDSIRGWLAANPAQADELMNTNPSYVFFREMPSSGTETGPQGGEGVRLTSKRSLAIDRSLLPYGFPVYLSADYTDDNGKSLNRLMMAQDTGGAIRGAVRGDVFWGNGATAERMAGPMKAKGEYYFLLPKTIR